MIVMNYMPEDIIEKKHVCYFTEVKNGEVFLKEMVELTIKHPESPDHAFIKKFDYDIISRTNLSDNSEKSAHMFLMEYAQKNCRNTIKLETWNA